MPRKNSRTATKKQQSKKTPLTNPCFEKTIEILESDDDFVTPNPSLRRKLRKSQFENNLNVSTSSSIIYESEDVVGFVTLSTTGTGACGTTFGLDKSNVIHSELRTPELDSEEVHQVGTSRKEHVNVIEINNFVLTETDSTLRSNGITATSSESSESWKTLMQRMQQNQKQISLNNTILYSKKSKVFSTKKTSKSLKGNKKTVTLPSKFKNHFSAWDNTDCSEVEVLEPPFPVTQESPPKRLKLEMSEPGSSTEAARCVTSSSSSSRSSESSPSTKLSDIADAEDSVNSKYLDKSVQSSSTNTTMTNINAKIPAMFLKPSERAALAKAQKTESGIQTDLCSALKLLSTEPDNFDSVRETADMFEGNIVKLSEYLPAVDPYAGNKTKICPFYKKLPGTRFSVDAFNYGLIPGIEVYFLSHFHSDHYIGLNKKFCKTLICSPPTANLIRMKLNVEDRFIRRLQLNKLYVIDGVEVTLINANHCPGSVMFVFRLPNGTTYFHTGDFRFTTDMLDNHVLQGLRIDCLYLDTTYCDPEYDFPTQTDAIAELIGVIKKKVDYRPKTLIVCGSYVIGKERVYFSLAEANKSKVFMNADKRRVINALENPRYTSYLVEREDEASIHVMQMFSIVPNFLSEYLATRTGKYTNIIGIKPSGWQFSSSGNGSTVRSHYNDTVTIIGVPYSEHSSFSELQQLVCATNPNKIQPTVNVGNTAKREAMMGHINKWLMK